MSLGVVVKGSSGVVLSADTRVTLTAHRKGRQSPPVTVAFDNAPKLLTFGKAHRWVAAVTYGEALIGARTPHSFLSEFQLELGSDRQPVSEYAQKLSQFFTKRWNDASMSERSPDSQGISFIVAGYDKDAPYGSVDLFNIPRQPQPERRNENGFGMTWGGQIEIVNRIIQGYDPALLGLLQRDFGLSDEQLRNFQDTAPSQSGFHIPYEVLPLQDCVDLAIFLIRTTITAQSLAVTNRGVGGSIEVVTVSPDDGLRWVQRRNVHGEDGGSR